MSMTNELKLAKQWHERLRLRAEGSKLWAEGNKLTAEGDKLEAEGHKLRAEGDKIRAEGDKLWAEGTKLRAEGNIFWSNAIIEAYGNITIEWKDSGDGYDCVLENGDVYKCQEKTNDGLEQLKEELVEAIWNTGDEIKPSDANLKAQAVIDVIQKQGFVHGGDVLEQVAEIAREKGKLQHQLDRLFREHQCAMPPEGKPMTDIEKTIAQLEALDKARTQGDWHFVSDEAQRVVLAGKNGELEYPYFGETICDNENYYPTSVWPENQRFIAAAPTMMQVIREIKAKLDEKEKREAELANSRQELAELVEAATCVLLGAKPMMQSTDTAPNKSILETWIIKQIADALTQITVKEIL